MLSQLRLLLPALLSLALLLAPPAVAVEPAAHLESHTLDQGHSHDGHDHFDDDDAVDLKGEKHAHHAADHMHEKAQLVRHQWLLLRHAMTLARLLPDDETVLVRLYRLDRPPRLS